MQALPFLRYLLKIEVLRMRTITTDRLIMRPPTRDDFEDCAMLWADPEVVRYIGGKPSAREESWARLTRYVGHWSLQGYGFWSLRERDTGRYAGEVGLADFKRNVTPSLSGAQEMGWVLGTWAHGKGYATEAVRAALGWNERHFPSARLVCMIEPANIPSLRVAEKCGFKEYARTVYKDADVVLLER
jgi:RimJ/RimL family protein N-acetyltransferase